MWSERDEPKVFDAVIPKTEKPASIESDKLLVQPSVLVMPDVCAVPDVTPNEAGG